MKPKTKTDRPEKWGDGIEYECEPIATAATKEPTTKPGRPARGGDDQTDGDRSIVC